MNCKKCGIEITIDNMYTKNKCLDCNNKYMRDYRKANKNKCNCNAKESMRLKRWLNGGERADDLGDDIKIGLRVHQNSGCLIMRVL